MSDPAQKLRLMFAGVLTEITSYSTATGIVLQTEGDTRLTTYGNLVTIIDAEDESRKYLATVTNVREKGVLPPIDHRALERIMAEIMKEESVSIESVAEALRELVFPGVERQFGLREVDLYILGEVRSDGGRAFIEFHPRPPRPYSKIVEPDPDLINRMLAHDCSFIVLGNHFVVDEAIVTLDPRRLTTHLAIVGQTGSGKTETVKRVALEYYARAGSGSSIIIFDVAGEYLGFPYTPGTGGPGSPVPLLDALMDPAAYVWEPRQGCREEVSKASPPKRVTVVVPYSAYKVGARKDSERAYFRRFKDLMDSFRPRVRKGKGSSGSPGLDIDNVLFGRHGIYTVDESREVREITLFEARAALAKTGNRYLVIALPVPDSLTIDEIIDIAGTQSEYAPTVIRAVADALGLMELSTVTSVTLVTEVFDIYLHVPKQNNRVLCGRMRDFAEYVVSEVRKRAGANAPIRLGDIIHAVKCGIATKIMRQGEKECEQGRTPWVEHYVNPYAWAYYLTLPLWREWDPETAGNYGVSRVFNPLDFVTVLAALESRDIEMGRPWGEAIPERFERACKAISRWPSQTVGSAHNALKKVSFRVASTLNHDLYREVASHVLDDGVTFVLLAPPSTGAAELPVARLVEGVFDAAVERYAPGSPRRTLIIVEEAHNLAPSKGDAPTKPGILRIAREGRKWGIGLVIVTQRPGFVDPDVLSQAATLIALRITNPDDIAGLRRSVESATSSLVERLPDLDRGQAIISGLAVPERRIPLIAKIRMLQQPPASTPAQSGGEGVGEGGGSRAE